LDTFASLREIQNNLKSGAVTCVQVVEACLENIDKHTNLNAFLEVYTGEALETAIQVDQKIAAGTAGRLAGLVVGLKDMLCYKNHPLQAGSRILEGFESQFNSTAVERLLEEDAIVIGRQNCDEFGMGSSNENSAFGPVGNGLDPDKVPGGSSGGSAVAVQMNMCHVSLGTDTGGSVRQPAAFTGIIGLKPTYSRISRYGLVAYASSFDSIGILSKSIEDNALILEIIAGADDYDSTVSTLPVPQFSDINALRRCKIGYIRESVETTGVQEEVKARTIEQLNQLQELGHEVEAVEFPLIDYVLPTYYLLITAEASSNLSRYDGVKYGYRSEHQESLDSLYKNTRSEGFGLEVQKRIMLGTFVLSARYYDAYYTKAQKVRRLIKDKTKELFDEFDFLVMPTTPTTAFSLGKFDDDPLEMYWSDLFTTPASVSGNPAISIPNGVDKNGLPIGFQIIADDFNEQGLYALSKEILNGREN
jgi:aspartyl-tRNA(Asn)/glutamyl-tRNA(Gln) amidotransferase subunit A